MAVRRAQLGGMFGSGQVVQPVNQIDVASILDAALNGTSTLLQSAYLRKVAEQKQQQETQRYQTEQSRQRTQDALSAEDRTRRRTLEDADQQRKDYEFRVKYHAVPVDEAPATTTAPLPAPLPPAPALVAHTGLGVADTGTQQTPGTGLGITERPAAPATPPAFTPRRVGGFVQTAPTTQDEQHAMAAALIPHLALPPGTPTAGLTPQQVITLYAAQNKPDEVQVVNGQLINKRTGKATPIEGFKEPPDRGAAALNRLAAVQELGQTRINQRGQQQYMSDRARLAAEYQKDPEVKSVMQRAQIVNQMERAIAQGKAADAPSLLQGYAKLLEPGYVTQGKKISDVLNALPISSRAKRVLNQWKTGDMLLPEQKDAFREIIEGERQLGTDQIAPAQSRAGQSLRSTADIVGVTSPDIQAQVLRNIAQDSARVAPSPTYTHTRLTAPGAKPPRLPGETPAQYLARIGGSR